jgi:ABC-type molybdate transport system substrate-binding protein
LVSPVQTFPVNTGECQVGIVYATDAAISKDVNVAGVFPENTHSPIIANTLKPYFLKTALA